MTIYKIPVEIKVIADTKDQAEDLICDILDKASIYGIGLSHCADHWKPYQHEIRIFDYSFMEEKE